MHPHNDRTGRESYYRSKNHKKTSKQKTSVNSQAENRVTDMKIHQMGLIAQRRWWKEKIREFEIGQQKLSNLKNRRKKNAY